MVVVRVSSFPLSAQVPLMISGGSTGPSLSLVIVMVALLPLTVNVPLSLTYWMMVIQKRCINMAELKV